MKRFGLSVCLVASIAGMAATSSTAAKPKLSKAELTWVTPLLKVWVARTQRSSSSSKTAAAKNALYRRRRRTTRSSPWSSGSLLSCKKPKDRILAAGKAPTRRMRTFGAALNSACIHNEAGAAAFTKAMVAYTAGKGKQVAQYLTTGISEFKLATTQLQKAYVAITAAGGSKVFTA